MRRLTIQLGLLLLLALLPVACGDDSNDGTDGDIDREQEAEDTIPVSEVDCDARRSEANTAVDVNCQAWCNKDAQCGGAVDVQDECLRDCRALTHEAMPEVLETWANCIVITACSTWERAKELGDTSNTLAKYCRSQTTAQSAPSPDRGAFCDELYEDLVACGIDSARTTQSTCTDVWSPIYSNETFRHIADCQPAACDDQQWLDCLSERVCSMATDRF